MGGRSSTEAIGAIGAIAVQAAARATTTIQFRKLAESAARPRHSGDAQSAMAVGGAASAGRCLDACRTHPKPRQSKIGL